MLKLYREQFMAWQHARELLTIFYLKNINHTIKR